VTVTEYAISGQLGRTETDRLKIELTKHDKTYRYIELDMPDSLFNNLVKGTSNNSVFKNQFGDKFIWSRYFIQKKLSRCFFDVFRPHCGLNIIKWTHLSREGF
jgi:hypothetical protein